MKNFNDDLNEAFLVGSKNDFNKNRLEQLCASEGIELEAFAPKTVKAIKNKVIPLRQNYLEGLIRSKTINNFSAGAGGGKTYTVLGTCVAMATATRFLYWKAETPVKIVYIDAEMPEEDIQERLFQFSEGFNGEQLELLDNNLSVMNTDDIGLNIPDLTSEIGQGIVEHYAKDAQVLVLDNFISVLSETDDKDPLKMKEFTNWLRKLRSSGLAVITVNHTVKSGDRMGSSILDTFNDLTIDLKAPTVKKNEEPKEHIEWVFSKARHRNAENKRTIPFKFSVTNNGVIFNVVR
ncbi:AAA family ATPase [Thalassotalea nanhaiensis]|uniref:AAA family ATPase n=1 Tax=Thalassotalea nanhaiensis TaxID=3065648 RepID=A0ABY9TID5_9GAMM|nr:AAA family ATPase [Colwelliaceae bacterium SQ345]